MWHYATENDGTSGDGFYFGRGFGFRSGLPRTGPCSPASRTISGTVRDADGAPVKGAVVSVCVDFSSGHDVTTDTNGRYEITWVTIPQMDVYLAGAPYSCLIARSVERALAGKEQINEHTTNLDMTLQPGVRLVANVKDETGRPVTNAIGMLAFGNADGEKPGHLEETCHSDSQGIIEIPAVPQAEGYVLNVWAIGYVGSGQRLEGPVRQTNRFEFPTIVLPIADQELAGSVLDKHGNPVVGAWVQAVAVSQVLQPLPDKPEAWEAKQVSGPDFGNTLTDKQGHFIFHTIRKGAIQLNFNIHGSSISVQTFAGNTNLLLRLREDISKPQ
jgi:hypothetical protein